MGACSSTSSTEAINCVRVIHINGYVQDFEAPVTVGQVTVKQTKHLLCSSDHLLSLGSTQHLRPDDVLQPGRFYYLLPHTVFQSATPMDLASLLSRLTAIGRTGPGPAPASLSKSLRFKSDGGAGGEEEDESGKKRKRASNGSGNMCSKARTWIPDLGTIKEATMSMERSMSMMSNQGNATPK